MPKRKAYSIKEKLEIVARIRNGQSQCKVARETGIAESTVRGWLKDEDKLRKFVDTVEDGDGLRRKKARQAKDDTLDRAVLNWFVQERHTGLPINGPVLKAQAEVLDQAINGPDSNFAASNGWLWRWQKRHGVKQLKIVGEKRSADTDGAAQFPAKLLTYIDEHDLVEEQIYNADESGLFYRMLPDTTLAQQNDAHRAEGFKLTKDKLPCCSASTKLGRIN